MKRCGNVLVASVCSSVVMQVLKYLTEEVHFIISWKWSDQVHTSRSLGQLKVEVTGAKKHVCVFQAFANWSREVLAIYVQNVADLGADLIIGIAKNCTSVSCSWVAYFQLMDVGTGPADPAAAGPIIWKQECLCSRQYINFREREMNPDRRIALSLWPLSFSVIFTAYFTLGRAALGWGRLAVTEFNP